MRIFYARKTKIYVIDDNTAQDFIKNNHRYRTSNKAFKKINLGMYYQKELIGVAQFCAPRTDLKKRLYTTELLRLCFKENVKIIGGASKLIKYYIKKYDPADIFTYQDTTGENSNVYEYCGMILVGQEKKKEYFIAPNKTIETANRDKKEILGMAYAVKYGPDRILGTKIGEVFHSENHPTRPNKRKSNREIFLEDLHWHIETTTGDKVYEWINPNRTYYTYKITATDSEKYYYGVSHIKKNNATIEDCLNDGYYGSGGTKSKNNKFINWKKRHENNLNKEVLQTFSTKSKAYAHEKLLINDLWKTDALCLNSIEGGIVNGLQYAILNEASIKDCPIHGKVKHQGNSCYLCQNQNSINIKNCEIHGETKHIGDKCYKCINNTSISFKNCKIHGKSKHIGNKCFKCSSAKSVYFDFCGIHGRTKFKGNQCCTCQSEKIVKIGFCEIHGETKFTGDKCKKCSASSIYTIDYCNKHGNTKFKKGKCIKCSNENRLIIKDCPIHGKSNHFKKSGNCLKCNRLKRKS